MNRDQWLVLGGGLFVFGSLLMKFAMFCGSYSDELLTACYVQRYAFSIPGLTFIVLGILFFTMGFLEPKKEH